MELQPNRDVGREPNHDQVQVASFLMLAGVIVGLILAIFILGRIWKGLQLKHILRCAFQVCRSGAGYFPTLRSSLMFLVLDSHRLALMFSRFGS